MSLIQRIDSDLRESLLKKQAQKTGALRMLKSALKNAAIATKVKEEELADEAVVAVIRQEAKKRREAMEAFGKGGRVEQADAEKAELAVLQEYLPPSLGADEIASIIAETVKDKGLTPPYQIGALMGPVMQKIAGRADGNEVKEAVQKFISAP